MSGIGSTGYAYTAENRLLYATTGGVLLYDPLGRLFDSYSPSLGYTFYAQDGDRIIAEETSGHVFLRRYVHGPGIDEPLVWYEGAGTGARRWLHADERGSIVAISNDAGAVTNVNSYDEYGVPASGNVGRFQYTGQLWLPELGLHHYRNRAYNQSLGRFMQTDPIGYEAGMNLYAYVGGDPVNLTDPLGLTSEDIWVFGCGSLCRYLRGLDIERVRERLSRDAERGSGERRDGGNEQEGAVVRGTRPRRLSPCIQAFLRSQGYGSPVLSDIRFIRGMNEGTFAPAAERQGAGAITLGRYVYVHRSQWDRITNPNAGPTFFEEVVHAIQWYESGTVGFALSYGLGVLIGGYDNHVEAQAQGTANRLFRAYSSLPPNQRCQS